MPDAPPPTPKELAAFRRGLVEGVEDGYVAAYVSKDKSPVWVYALRFSSSSRVAQEAFAKQQRDGLRRMSQGTIVVVFNDRDPGCSGAILRHLSGTGFR
jgi:hypothetical protein